MLSKQIEAAVELELSEYITFSTMYLISVSMATLIACVYIHVHISSICLLGNLYTYGEVVWCMYIRWEKKGYGIL